MIGLVIGIFCPQVVYGAAYNLTTGSIKNSELPPSEFKYMVEAGDVIEDVLYVQRKASKGEAGEVEALIHPVDASMTSNGFLTMSSELSPQKYFGVWAVSETPEISIMQGYELPFKVQIPENATPGQYAGGFVLVEKELEGEKEEDSGAKIRMRYATTLNFEIKGDLKPEFGINNPKLISNEGMIEVSFDFENVGNTIYEFEGNINVSNMFLGDQIVEVPYRKVLPGEVVTVKQNVEGSKFLIGKVSADFFLSLSTSMGDETKIDTYVNTVEKSYYSIVGILAFGLLFIAIYCIIIRLLKGKIRWEEYKVKSGEDVQSVADKYGAKWQAIAKKNKLSPPYHLHTRQIILVPNKGDGTKTKKQGKPKKKK